MRIFLIIYILVIAVTVSILGFRGSLTEKEPFEVFNDMDRQAKYKPQAENAFFANGQNPKNFHSIIVKSPHCEPEFYDEWVEKNFNVDAIGSTSANLITLGHTICDRPMYPMENDTEFNQTIEIYK